MTIEETKEAIKTMQAFMEGKPIQCRPRAFSVVVFTWEDDLNPDWDWSIYEYRTKPEPRRIWVNVYKNRDGREVQGNHFEDFKISSRSQHDSKNRYFRQNPRIRGGH